MNAEQIKNGLYNLIVERLENRIPIYQYEYTQLAKEATKYLIANEITVRGEIGGFSIDVIKLVADKFKNENPKKIKQFRLRFIRNVFMYTCATVLTDENIEITFRHATNFWTDSEILDIIDDVKVLNDIKNVWTNDKDTGFAQVPQEYRPAAIAGNYGAIIERKIEITAEETAATQKQPQQYKADNKKKNELKVYFTDEFVKIGWFELFVSHLTESINKGWGSQSEFASLLLMAMKNNNVTIDDVRKMPAKKWWRKWTDCFGTKELTTKPERLNKLTDTKYGYLR